jgi:hypothetical protein
MSVVDEFLQHEFDEFVLGALRQDMSSRLHAYHTFNVFNVKIDPDARLVTVQDVLDPTREQVIDLDEFARLIEGHSHTQEGPRRAGDPGDIAGH